MSKPTARKLQAKTAPQSELMSAIREHDVTVATGSAGTGKTYIVAAVAAQMFLQNQVKQIVLTRPNVACSETLGLFPGTLADKFTIWLAPLISTLKEYLGVTEYEAAYAAGVIVLQPLETIRGASFKDSIILVDECENMSFKEIDAVLTRLGENSKIVMTGDLAQADINNPGLRRLWKAAERADLQDYIALVDFGPEDIVRSKFVKAWVTAIDEGA